jgi:hypothetical protein
MSIYQFTPAHILHMSQDGAIGGGTGYENCHQLDGERRDRCSLTAAYSGCRLGEIGGVGVKPPRRGRLFVGEQPPCTPVAYRCENRCNCRLGNLNSR